MIRLKHICKKCKVKFKKEQDLESHLDVHTPFWQGMKITLSGADQIRLLLKESLGGWDKVIADEAKRIQTKGMEDFDKLQRLRDFEESNCIEFVVCVDKIKGYRSIA